VVGPALVRAVPVDERLWPGLGWGVALLTAVAVVSWGWTWSGGGGPAGRVRRVALLAVLSLVVVAVASAFGIYGELAAQLGRRCTAWAGNAAVNGADTDLIASVLGVGDGLAVVLLWACLAVPKRDVPTRDGGWRSSPSTPTGVGDDGLRCDHVAEPGA
jgi:hypothetical protein